MSETRIQSDSDECRAPVRVAHHPCCLCGRDDSELLFRVRDRLHGCEGLFTYVRCPSCGLVYMDPQIATDDLPGLYPADYAPHQPSAQKRPRRRSPDAAIRKKPFVSQVCARLSHDSRLLDVGCGNGAFLDAVRTLAGCAVCGVDISRAAVAATQAYGIEVFAGTLPEAPFADESFDAITAWWYLEHVPNPLDVLVKIRHLLRPDGRCILGVPNVASWNARVFRDRWFHLDCPRHLYLYSPVTISRLLEKAGFVVEGIAFDPGTLGLVQSLRYRFGPDTSPLSRRPNPPGLRLLRTVARPWTRLLAWLKQSDLIVVCARKTGTTGSWGLTSERRHGTSTED
jgi:SAM-dependent methyltransferase